MSESWEPLTSCNEVKVGMKVRRALNPEKQPYKDLLVKTVVNGHLGFDDEVIVACSALAHDHYWYRRNWPEL